jgi:lipid II:glycine glycyltransferase (peptidoglycan interpeptide bridge formation enzyme)
VNAASVPEGWDEGVLSLHGHFLQSTAWARVQERLGYRIVVGAHRDWCWLGVVRHTGPFSYLYLPFGPSLRSPAALPDALDSARAAARRLGCAFVRFEPDEVTDAELLALKARRVRSRQHEHTLMLRLDVDEATLRRGLRSGHRSGINSAEKRGLSLAQVRDPGDITDFIALLRQTEARGAFYSHDAPYYHAIADELMPTGEASLYYASVDGQRVAGVLVFDFGLTRHYAFAASDPQRRSVMPGPPLAWRTILDGRAKGLRWFDFWGIAPPDQPEHSWAGITEFKRGFGGEVHTRAGTWELPVRPLRARLFRVAQALRR